MIVKTFYLSDPGNVEYLLGLMGMSLDELEIITGGYFKDNHRSWPGQLKGEVVLYANGKLKIRHHFTKKKLWEEALQEI